MPAGVRSQIDRELQLIEELGYPGYFLTLHAVVQFARSRGILCQGRGSAANSVVCYCLEITAIDPVRMDLLFERFMSRERAEPPDIEAGGALDSALLPNLSAAAPKSGARGASSAPH